MTSARTVAGIAARVEMPAFGPLGEPAGPDEAMAHLHAHTLTASTQAAAACGELAEIFDTRGEHATAALFRQIAVAEAERAAEAIRGIEHRPLPARPAWQHYSWLYQDSPTQGARKLVARLITSPLALRVALEVCERVKLQYERQFVAAPHPDVRSRARELTAEKAHQMRLIASALAVTDDTERNGETDLLFAMP